MTPTKGFWLGLIACLMCVPGLGLPARAAPEAALSKGQLVYVPVYSHVYHGDREMKIFLTDILSIRNTDLNQPITITKVDYFDSDGKLVKRYVTTPVTIKPMASIRYIVKESDAGGGSGANFLVQWQADAEVNEPLMEGVMIGTTGQQGISFTSRGKAIKPQ